MATIGKMTDTELIDELEKQYALKFQSIFNKPDYECIGWNLYVDGDYHELHGQRVHQGPVNGKTFREALQAALIGAKDKDS